MKREKKAIGKMEKDWEMMTEFDKDEIIRKKIIHEL